MYARALQIHNCTVKQSRGIGHVENIKYTQKPLSRPMNKHVQIGVNEREKAEEETSKMYVCVRVHASGCDMHT